MDVSNTLRCAGWFSSWVVEAKNTDASRSRGGNERSNRDVAAALLERLGKPWSLVRSVADRPGHDRRYAMDGSKLEALGWRNRMPFEKGLAETVDWYVANQAWWRSIKSGEWADYYRRQYGERLAGSRDAS